MQPLTAKDLARMIADAVAASLRVAHEQGVLTPDNHAAIARAAGNNAAALIQLEIAERGIESPY